MKEGKVTRFDGAFAFLSNFYRCKVGFEGDLYRSVEHAYQAAKTTDFLLRLEIRQAATPGKAKRLGGKLSLRPGWDKMRVDIMRGLLLSKFRDKRLRNLLMLMGGVELVEGNNWGDAFWGVCHGKGQNMLGQLLMQVRAEIIEELKREKK